MIWVRRRRPPLWMRVARAALLAGSAVGLAAGAVLLRRKLDGSRRGRRIVAPFSRR